MNVPDILGVEVLTPDGRGSILSLHPRKVIVRLNMIEPNQIMKGLKRETLNYAYDYEDVEIIKGQYCFDENRIHFQYGLPVSSTDSSKKICVYKVDGQCPLHNVQCTYPDCEK